LNAFELSRNKPERFQSCRHWLNGTLVKEYPLFQNDPCVGGPDATASPLTLSRSSFFRRQRSWRTERESFQQNSTANPFGAGSPFSPNGINNSFSPYGSPFSNQSTKNPFATDAPGLYDQQGNYRGTLSAKPYDPDSTGNPYGRYGSPFSPDSINNPYGAGSPYRSDSSTNPYGRGMRIEGQ
jgi:hypothetical protein